MIEGVVLRQQRGGGSMDRTVYIGSKRIGFTGPQGRNSQWWIAEFAPGDWRKGVASSEEEAVRRIVDAHTSYDLLYAERRKRAQASVVEAADGSDGSSVHSGGPSEAGAGADPDPVASHVPSGGER